MKKLSELNHYYVSDGIVFFLREGKLCMGVVLDGGFYGETTEPYYVDTQRFGQFTNLLTLLLS